MSSIQIPNKESLIQLVNSIKDLDNQIKEQIIFQALIDFYS